MKPTLATLGIVGMTIANAQCLTPIEVDSILFMKQEEKLAHDVYARLYDRWEQPIFSNIAQSEAQHVAAVDSLIKQFSLADPAPSDPGKFTIQELQTLHDDLIAQGEESLIDALLVGRLIELTDIADLDRAMEAASDPSVIMVFASLRKGSVNHLSAFTSKLEPLYQPLTEPSLDLQFDSDGHPVLHWNDEWHNETEFRIEQKVGQSAWKLRETLAANTTTYTDFACGVGITDYRVMVVSPYETSVSESIRCLRPYVSYDSWQADAFDLISDTRASRSADPDQDGLVNVEEYAFGSNPVVPDFAGISFESRTDGQTSLIRYQRANLEDISSQLQTSQDLAHWNPAVTIIESISSPGPGLVKITALMETKQMKGVFVRISTF